MKYAFSAEIDRVRSSAIVRLTRIQEMNSYERSQPVWSWARSSDQEFGDAVMYLPEGAARPTHVVLPQGQGR
jgi:hypothetical protein